MTANKLQAVYLSELLQGLVELSVDQEAEINSVQLDSRKLQADDCFIAIQGNSCHGLDHIAEAISKGVSVVLVDQKDADRVVEFLQISKASANIVLVEQLARQTGLIARRFYAMATHKLKTFAVTGTNGKTSVSHFIAQAIEQLSGRGSCGLIGTLGNGLLGEMTETGMTTPDAVQLHRSLARMQEQGAQAVVIEASSHGLAQHRLSGLDVDVAVFTNLSRDHLDYHADMQAYGEAKLALFKMPGLAAAVLNADDPFFRQIVALLSDQGAEKIRIMTYALSDKISPIDTVKTSHIFCQKLQLSIQGLRMDIAIDDDIHTLQTGLLGRFNASNLLAALAALLAQGYDRVAALAALSKVQGVAGRMEVFSQAGLAHVVVDFAHTPDGLHKALETLREICEGRLYCVFGCGGDRDKGKRSLMAKAAEELADQIIVTNDNPRSEAAQQIADEILSGFKNKAAVKVILDRKKAIQTAIESAQTGDIILLAGKGHESWQEIEGKRFPFNDRTVVLNLLAAQADQKGGADD